jgi:secondary thiamine-phosphate synthase enzyme
VAISGGSLHCGPWVRIFFGEFDGRRAKRVLVKVNGEKELVRRRIARSFEGCRGNAMHITASVFINDDESGLHEDYKKWLEGLAPFDASPQRYRHNRTGEDNADAHMKRQIMGREVVIAITQGKLDFGPWEQIFYGEFDGRRPKRVLVKVIGE